MKINNSRIFEISIFIIAIIFLFTPIKTYIQNIIFDNTGDKIEKNKMDLALKGINTPDINLKDFHNKIIFLNFWGTWCPPCREEMPSIQQLYQAKNKEVVFVLVAMKDKEEKIKQYIQQNKLTVPIYVATSLIDDSIKPKVFPTTYIIGKNGTIEFQKIGAMDWNSNEMINKINQLK